MSARIRLAHADDGRAIAAIYAPYCTDTAVSFESVAPTPEEMGRRVKSITQTLPWLVLEDGGRVAGYVYAGRHRERAAYRWSVDVTAYVAPDYHRRGVGRALYTALFRLLVLQGYVKAYAGVTLPNPASVGLHEAMGFQPVGVYRGVGHKFGHWHDVGWYQLALQPEVSDPAEPCGISEVLDSAKWEQALEAGLRLYRAS